MPDYMTKQRQRLLTFLQNNTDKGFTAREIFECLREDGISQSAVYRNLAFLEKTGAVRKSAGEGSRDFVYQYLAAKGCDNCLHLTCILCGEIRHLKNNQAQTFEDGLVASDDFYIDRKKTVIYGRCRNCRN